MSAGAECSAANIGALPCEQTAQASRWFSCPGDRSVALRTPRGRTGSVSGPALRDAEIAETRNTLILGTRDFGAGLGCREDEDIYRN